jgi:uncharacterized protein YkwD
MCFAVVGCGQASNSGQGGNTMPNDSAVQHNLDALNAYRAQAGAPPLRLSDALNMFATTGSEELANGGAAHGHFGSSDVFASGFCHGAGENQAPGWDINGDENGTIDRVLKAMMDEGPGGGHHDNIVNPAFALVGVGLVVKDGGLYFTNDFSNACD